MPKFTIKYQHEFTAVVEAADLIEAERIARKELSAEPRTKLLYIAAEGVVAVPTEPDGKPTPPRPFGRPNGGGTPGTPVLKKDILVDAIAKAA